MKLSQTGGAQGVLAAEKPAGRALTRDASPSCDYHVIIPREPQVVLLVLCSCRLQLTSNNLNKNLVRMNISFPILQS